MKIKVVEKEEDGNPDPCSRAEVLARQHFGSGTV